MSTQAIAGGIGTGAALDPEPISKTILGVVATVAKLFGAKHAAAVATEGHTLNGANPAFVNACQAIMSALSAGTITEAQALAALDQAQANYYATVAPIIKGTWHYGGSQFPEPTYADSYANRSGPFGSKDANPDSHAPSTCNASCVLGHYFVERTIVGLKRLIQSGGGTFLIEPFPANGAIAGTPAIPISYARASVLTTIDRTLLGTVGLSSSGSSGNFMLLILAAVIFLGFVVLGRK